MSRLSETFARLKGENALGVFPYLTAGYPDPAASPGLLAAMLEAGADGFEIGIPFSDPMADGATLQRANEQALRNGATVDTALALAQTVSASRPVVFMSYYNPLLAFGETEFCRAAAEVGAAGVIVPDLPPEESEPLRAACGAAGLDYIFMLGPTSTRERIELAAGSASGFIYCVALVGVTGARSELSTGLGDFLASVRAATDVPLVLGFGIAKPEHVHAVRNQAGGVIVASALADLIASSPPKERASALATRVRELKEAGRAEGSRREVRPSP